MNDTVEKLSRGGTAYPSDRVSAFIALAREIEALVPNEGWDADMWPVGVSFITKGQNRASRVLAFYNRDATLTNRQEIVGGAPLAPSFKDFAKAYVRYMHSTSPVTFENTMKRLDSLQFIEAGFRGLGLDPLIENLNISVLNTAVSLAKEGVGPGRHYQFAINIQQVYRFCFDRKLLAGPFQWKHGIRKPKDRTEEIGKEAREWREERLPSAEAYWALAHVYRNADTFVDLLYSRLTAIFVAVPIRIHEVLQLRDACEVFEKVKNPETDEMQGAYGIRVSAGKGNPPQVKWVPTEMVSLVRQAVSQIRELCAPARAVAAWYEANPGKLWLPEHLEQFRDDEWLGIEHLGCVAIDRPIKELSQWVRQRQVEWRSGDAASTRVIKEVRMSSVAGSLLQDLPANFPRFNSRDDQTYSETLALLFLNQAHARRGTYASVIEPVTIQSYSHWLSGHDGGKMPSVFERFQLRERDGSAIRITSHAFRHWLNTVAQLRGMSDLDIAKWSGRDLQQNQAYNHVTPEEMLSQIRAALDDGSGIGPMFEAARATGINRPVDRKEFAEAQLGAALTTELGICVHDYSLLPCQTHGDCLGCSENVFFKGDEKHRDNIAKRLALSEKQLDAALWALGADYFGADKWVLSHEASIAKMREMIAVHDDPAVPDGTVVSLRGASRDGEVAMALRDRDEGWHGLGAGAAYEAADDGIDEMLAGMWEV